MAWTRPVQRASNFTVTASVWNTDLIDNLAYLYDGSQDTAYTPTWTTAGTAPGLGNATMVGRYGRVGKFILFRISFTAGTTTTFGTGRWSLTLPPIAALDTTGIFTALLYDASAGLSKIGVGYMPTTSTISITYDGDTALGITNTTPFAWAVNDSVQVSGCYIAATN